MRQVRRALGRAERGVRRRVRPPRAFEWGNRVEPDELERVLGENPGTKVVYTTLSETSTGVVNDIETLTEVAHKHGALIIVVDAVSGLGAIPIPQDEWGVDVSPPVRRRRSCARPGSASRARTRRRSTSPPSVTNNAYYFDWQKTLKGQRKDPPDSPFTPAVSIFMGLDVALRMIENEGLENVFERHRQLGSAVARRRQGARPRAVRSRGRARQRRHRLQDPRRRRRRQAAQAAARPYNITANGGQNQLKGKILRIAHTGYFGAFDIITSVAAIELALRDLGADVELGAGVAAAQRVFQEAGVPAGAPA